MTKRTTYTPATSAKAVAYKSIPVEGVDVAYREAGDPEIRSWFCCMVGLLRPISIGN